jgi:hypothetical protein
MRHFSLKKVLFGFLFAFSTSSSFAADALVDDFSGGTDLNNFEYHWYYYDDNAGTREKDRPQVMPHKKPSVIDVAHQSTHPRHAGGSLADTFPVNSYVFNVSSGANGNKYGSMPFTFGTSWKPANNDRMDPFVGIATQLCADGNYIDLTGADTVSFKLKAHVTDLTVSFRIETMDVILDSSSTYHCFLVYLPKGMWVPVSVDISSLMQPPWRQTEIPFDIKKAANLSWQVDASYNSAVFSLRDSTDTLDIDDVVIHNFSFNPPGIWTPAAAMRPANGLFSNFEKINPAAASQNGTPLGTYWFGNTDNAGGGNSKVIKGMKSDSSGLQVLDWKDSTGFSGQGYGAFADMQLGPRYKRKTPDSTIVQGCIGIGANLYDSLNNNYFNAQTGNLGSQGAFKGAAKSIYFEYRAQLDAGCKYLTLEISDSNDVADKAHPTRKDKRGPDVRWYRNLPISQTWRAVEIPFDSLVVHKNWLGYKDIALCKTALAKIQFKVHGPDSAKGIFQIDNVYFPGCDFVPVVMKKDISNSRRPSEFRVSIKNNNLRICWNPQSRLAHASVGLLDAKGMLVRSAVMRSTMDGATDIALQNIPAGSYIVQLKGMDAAGTARFRRSAITIIK